jgi:hypothetical protein
LEMLKHFFKKYSDRPLGVMAARWSSALAAMAGGVRSSLGPSGGAMSLPRPHAAACGAPPGPRGHGWRREELKQPQQRRDELAPTSGSGARSSDRGHGRRAGGFDPGSGRRAQAARARVSEAANRR